MSISHKRTSARIIVKIGRHAGTKLKESIAQDDSGNTHGPQLVTSYTVAAELINPSIP